MLRITVDAIVMWNFLRCEFGGQEALALGLAQPLSGCHPNLRVVAEAGPGSC
jgi:hypothetical protein